MQEMICAVTKSYTTKDIADAVGVHVNTVRFYEKIGYLTKPRRKTNGYRVYTALQLAQCRLIRLAMRAEILQNGLREKAVEIVTLSAALRFDAALSVAEEYKRMIHTEIHNARAAIASAGRLVQANRVTDDHAQITRQEAAKLLNVTSETLRTWERSGLIAVKRKLNGYRVYTPSDLERLNLIRTLRLANYSLSSILRLLNDLDRNAVLSMEETLNTPKENEDITSACDRLIAALQDTAEDAKGLADMLGEMQRNFSTLQ